MWTDNETSLDLLGFQVHADLVRSVVVDPKLLPVTIGVFADWGGGKTSIMKMLEKSLEPESWPAGSADRERCEKIACLYFNGWTFEGYDDAKSAILSSVLLALGEHTRWGPKVRRRCVSLLKSVNWMRVASLGLKHVAVPTIAAYASGGTSLVPAFAGSLASLVPWGHQSESGGDAGGESKKEAHDGGESVDWESLIKKDRSPAGPLDVRTFRKQFGKMLKECNVDSLVVLIDDLDRCSPERIIENLEAIKLFLNVEQTAFVIGADPRIVRHAISLKYHKKEHLSEEADAETPSTVVTDYLEKLIQYPYRLPRLSPAEVETYMALLFCQYHLAGDRFLKTVEACDHHRGENRYAVFGYAPVLETLQKNGDPQPGEDFIQALTFCAHVSPLITEGLKGNPRQVKRFLNAFMLRKKLASVAKLSNIKDDVLVKLMILEYGHEKRFRQLYDWQAAENGRPSQLAAMERSSREEEDDAAGKKATPLPFPEDWSAPQLRSWIGMQPLLADVDLRDYFWVARDRLQSSMAGLSMVPPIVRRTFENLVSANVPQRHTAARNAADLSEPERDQLFDLLEQSIHKKPAEKAGYDGFRQLVESGVANAPNRMAAAILDVLTSQVPAAVGTDLDTLVKAKTELAGVFETVLNKWKADGDTRVGRALKTITATPRPRSR
jgi:hypothetical protein